MNKGLLSISATCSNCNEVHTLSQCTQTRIVTPITNWPTSPGGEVINFVCPDCQSIVFTQTIK